MSDLANITPINNINDSIKNKLFVVIEGEEIQFDYRTLGLTFESSEEEIMNKIVPIVQEDKGVDITDTYKVRKSITNENIFIYPNSVAGV
jgi:hypothetical protein